jgi:L-aspartate oxidase
MHATKPTINAGRDEQDLRPTRYCDFLVIGSGLAGLAFALKVAEFGRVIILSKAHAPETNTAMAQGGIAAVMGDDDSFESHIQDTLIAGAGLCKESIVRLVVESAPSVVQQLIEWGVKFDITGPGGKIDLTREGGHSHRRILHVQDHTGEDIHRSLLYLVGKHPNIEVLEEHFAIDLIVQNDEKRVAGARVFDRPNWRAFDIRARFTMLATGGAGKTYLYTSNWSGATGDGIAMAWRAGARVANLEFMQFHPTCLYHPEARNFLITEAIRGEGGELVDRSGEAFAKRYHELGSLAPRDIVARSIDAEMKKTGANCMYLDISHRPADYLRERFPAVYKKCLEYGIDLTKQPIPIVPAAHYLCGGVVTDENGRTDLKNLYAAGETAFTGLHGANRLASNSLLECLVFAERSAKDAIQLLHSSTTTGDSKECSSSSSPTQQSRGPGLRDYQPAHAQDEEQVAIAHMWEEIRRLMWNYVGIVRSNRRLEAARARLKVILDEIERDHSEKLLPDAIELRNIATVADLTVRCAQNRKESRGIHYNLDYPSMLPGIPQDTVLIP